MRQWASTKLRSATVALCCVGVALGIASIGLAFSVPGPSRTLRPILPYADSAYIQLYIGMAGAGLLILGGLIGVLGALWGNRGVDLGACVPLLAGAGLALGALALAGGLKGSAQTNLDPTLAESLKRYGPGDAATFDAWNELQTEMGCCAVRTNMAQQAFEPTPWYRAMREGNAHAAPKIPPSCCTKASPAQMADCTYNKPSLPAQNPLMNPVGCFESMGARLDAYSSRFIIVGVLIFLGAGAALGVLVYSLVLSVRRGGGGSSLPSTTAGKGPGSMKFGNSRAGSVAGTASVAGGGQPLMSQKLGGAGGSSVYSSRHSLFSEPPKPIPRHPSESSLPSLAARSLFSEPPAVTTSSAIQAQPMRPRPQQQQQQQKPTPKPRSSVAGSVAGAPSFGGSVGTLSAMSHQSQLPAPTQPQPQPQPQPLQAQPMKKPQQQPQKPIVLSAQPLRSQPMRHPQRK